MKDRCSIISMNTNKQVGTGEMHSSLNIFGYILMENNAVV